MLQTLERAVRDSHDRRDARATNAASPLKVTLHSAEAVAPGEAVALRPVETHAEEDDGLIAAAGPIMMAGYAVVL